MQTATAAPLSLSDEELLPLLSYDNAHLLEALRWAELYGDDLFKASLAAGTWEGEDTGFRTLAAALLTLAFVLFWDRAVGVYRREDGREVTNDELRESLDFTLDNATAQLSEVDRISRSLQNRGISVKEWQLGMMEQVRSTHINAAVSASGGYHAMSPADWDKIGEEINRHYQYLNRFAVQLERGERALDGRFLVRSKLYVQAARQTHEEFMDVRQALYGYTEVKNLLKDLVRSCHDCDGRPGCIELTAAGWMKYDDPEWVVPGARCCLGNCRCKTLRRNPTTGDTRR